MGNHLTGKEFEGWLGERGREMYQLKSRDERGRKGWGEGLEQK